MFKKYSIKIIFISFLSITMLFLSLNSYNIKAEAASVYSFNDFKSNYMNACLLSESNREAIISSMPEDDNVSENDEGDSYESGQIIVTFKYDTPNKSEIHALQESVTLDVSDESKINLIAKGIAVVPVYKNATVSQAINELSKDSRIQSAEVNNFFKFSDITAESYEDDSGVLQSANINDQYASYQWCLNNSIANIYEMWDSYKAISLQNDKIPVIAILDSGIDSDHPDLKDRIVYPYCAIDGENSYEDIDNEKYHGTVCAGIIAATTNNNIGVACISYNSYVMPIRIFSKKESGKIYSTTLSVILGINYVMDKKSEGVNVNVINMSFGIPCTSKNDLIEEQALCRAIENAKEDNILCVASVGNDSTNETLTNVEVPACHPDVLAVGSINFDGKRSYFSNGDDTLDIMAPGEQIFSTSSLNYDDNGYTYESGTSMAAPYVAAVAGLCFKYGQNATVESVISAITSTAYDIGSDGFDSWNGYGQIRPKEAIDYIIKNSKEDQIQEPRQTQAIMPTGAESLEGENRYETMAKIVLDAYPNGNKHAIIATWESFPDALGASSLAGMYDCPVILTESSKLTDCSRDVITKLGATEFTIIGGTAAVSENVEQSLTSLGTVDRISGEDRYDTDLKIFDKVSSDVGNTAIIATGENYLGTP